jgi:hypothetical protein
MADEQIDPETVRRDAERVILSIKSHKDTITTIRAALRQDMPAVMQALEEAEVELPELLEAAKVVLRRLGPGEHVIHGHSISVNNAPISVSCDVDGLVERALARDEVQDLLNAGVLKYNVVPHQIERLSAKLKAIYGSYLKKQRGTAAVSFPTELK